MRNLRAGQIAGLFFAASTWSAEAAGAQNIQVDYLDIPPPYVPTLNNNTGAIPSGQTFNLPGYGNVVVSWADIIPGSLPSVGTTDVASFYGAQTTASPIYSWGTDTQWFNFARRQSASTYNVTFTFIDVLPPDLDRLVLAVENLAANGGVRTTVSTPAAIPVGQLGCFIPPPPPALVGQQVTGGNVIESTSTAQINTGLCLYDVVPALLPVDGSGFSVLNLTVAHRFDDDIRLSIGYLQPLSTLKICKVAGEGVDEGALFDFDVTVDGASVPSVSVPAGPAPAGWCTVAGSYTTGSEVVVTEVTDGFTMTDVSCFPIDSCDVFFDTSSASATLGEGVTELTFTNEQHPGYLEICKTGNVSGMFSFSVTGVAEPVVVPAGACSPALLVNAGTVSITETTPGANLVDCSTIPAGNQVDCDPDTLTSTVTVAEGDISDQTIAYMENCIPSPVQNCGG